MRRRYPRPPRCGRAWSRQWPCLLQELAQSKPKSTSRRSNALATAPRTFSQYHGYRRFRDHHQVIGHGLSDLIGHSKHVLQICRAVFRGTTAIKQLLNLGWLLDRRKVQPAPWHSCAQRSLARFIDRKTPSSGRQSSSDQYPHRLADATSERHAPVTNLHSQCWLRDYFISVSVNLEKTLNIKYYRLLPLNYLYCCRN